MMRYLKLLRKILAVSLKGKKPYGGVPYKLSLSITNKCNCRCLICRVWKVYHDRPELENEELNALEWNKFFEINGRDFYWIAITGGEPFLKKDFTQIIASCIKNCPNLLLLSVVTNGFAAGSILEKTEEILKISKDVKLYIVVSVDGEKEIHEKLRQAAGGYEKVLRTIALLEELAKKHANLKVRLETIISRHNLKDSPEFIDSELIKRHDVSFAFAQESERYFNQDTSVSLKGMGYGMLAAVINKLAAKAGFFPHEKLILKIYYRLSGLFFLRPHKQVIPCAASAASVFVGPYGEVRPCIMMDAAGKLPEYDFDLKKVLNCAAMLKLKEKIVAGECPNCWTPCEAMQSIIQDFPRALMMSCRGAGNKKGI